MTNEKQALIDQAACRSILEHQNKRSANQPAFPDKDLAAGDFLETAAGEVAIEQRHLDGVALFLANHYTADAAGCNFRVQPADPSLGTIVTKLSRA